MSEAIKTESRHGVEAHTIVGGPEAVSPQQLEADAVIHAAEEAGRKGEAFSFEDFVRSYREKQTSQSQSK